MNHYIESYGYTVISKDNGILEELRKNDNTIINWFNYNDGDIYYSDNCTEYYIVFINHEKKILKLSKDKKDLL